MANIINWHLTNKSNNLITGHEVYRSLDKTNVYDIGNKIGTVAANIDLFSDETALANVPYYYGVRVVFGANHIDSAPRCIAYIADVGPGPENIAIGDYDAAVMGSFNLGLYTQVQEEIIAALAPKNMTKGISTNGDYKVIYKGKICYLPNNLFLQYYNSGNGANMVNVANEAIAAGAWINQNNKKYEVVGREYLLKLADYEFARNFFGYGKRAVEPFTSEKCLITFLNDDTGKPSVGINSSLYHPGSGGGSNQYARSLFTTSTNSLTRFETADSTTNSLGNSGITAIHVVAYFELQS